VTVLVTGSSGHLGEALVRTLKVQRREAIGIDILPGAFTHLVGSINDRDFVRRCMNGVGAVLHPATLHKPHVATHSRQDFVDVNITGTLNLLEEAVAAGVTAFVFTSTTSVFGDALAPPSGEPAAWVTEDVAPLPKNIYGVTKVAAEDLCELIARDDGMPVLVLRASLSPASRRRYTDVLAGSPLSREDAWHRAVEFLFERLAVSWTIAGTAPLTRQRELLARLRGASTLERTWVRERLREHCVEHFPDITAP